MKIFAFKAFFLCKIKGEKVRKERSFFKRLSFFASFLFFLTFSLYAEKIENGYYGFSLDAPCGFTLKEYGADGTSFFYQNKYFPVYLLLRVYKKSEYSSTDSALESSLSNLKTEHEMVPFTWAGRASYVAPFELDYGVISYSGEALAVSLFDDEILLLMCYAPKKYYIQFAQFIISTLNSLELSGSKEECGAISAFAFPKMGEETTTLKIASREVAVHFDKADKDANDFAVNMEYAVLIMYAGKKEEKEAWQRYYRAVYRDGFSRIKRAAKEIRKAFSSLNIKEFNAVILKWIQDFPYGRGSEESADFTNVIDCMRGKESDCDARCVLACSVLRRAGAAVALFVSPFYSHALYGVNIEADGVNIYIDNRRYLLCETTAHVEAGVVAAEQRDGKKWIVMVEDY